MNKLVEIGDQHILKHTPAQGNNQNPYTSIFTTEHCGISDKAKIIKDATSDQREGKIDLSKYIVHSIDISTYNDNFGFEFPYEENEGGKAKVIATFTTKMGKVFEQHKAKAVFRIGYFATLMPYGEGSSDGKIYGTFDQIQT